MEPPIQSPLWKMLKGCHRELTDELLAYGLFDLFVFVFALAPPTDDSTSLILLLAPLAVSVKKVPIK